MTVLPGCDPVSQTLYCLQHIGSVATALRTDVVKATVGMTVYYCASIGAKGLVRFNYHDMYVKVPCWRARR